MTDLSPTDQPARGRISQGPTELLVEQTLVFLRRELPGWRDDPRRVAENAEERLNAQLCKYLNVASNHRFPMIHFSHEEKQSGIRRVDVSALPTMEQFVGLTYHSIYDPFLVLEGKRLPAPSRNREREYVTGGDDKSGGIQRFKLGLHGANQKIAVIIGYVQQGEVSNWERNINSWIRELVGKPASTGEEWFNEEQLTEFVEDGDSRIATASSVHKRVGDAVSQEIGIRHFWVCMKSRPTKES
jgi:hypothetical protein